MHSAGALYTTNLDDRSSIPEQRRMQLQFAGVVPIQ